MTMIAPSTAQFEAATRKKADLEVVFGGEPRPAKKIDYVPAPKHAPIERDGLPCSGIWLNADEEGNWLIVQGDADDFEVLVVFDGTASVKSVEKIAAKMRKVWNEAYDLGFGDGMDEGWEDGYKAGRGSIVV